MTSIFRRVLRGVLAILSRYPSLKRVIVDTVYRIPTLDAALRTVAHRVNHPDAILDVTAASLPESSRRAYDRMKTKRGS